MSRCPPKWGGHRSRTVAVTRRRSPQQHSQVAGTVAPRPAAFPCGSSRSPGLSLPEDADAILGTGGMAEWTIAAVLKTARGQPLGSSNLPPSATHPVAPDCTGLLEAASELGSNPSGCCTGMQVDVPDRAVSKGNLRAAAEPSGKTISSIHASRQPPGPALPGARNLCSRTLCSITSLV